jgi:hypothetical protein
VQFEAMTQKAITELFLTLARRDQPESVAHVIKQNWPEIERNALRRMIGGILGKTTLARFGWSTMSTRFRGPVPMTRQLAKAEELARLFLDERLDYSGDTNALDQFITEFSALIGRDAGSSFRDGRLPREERRRRGLTLSRRRYDKLFRLAQRLETRRDKLRNEEARYRLVLVSKAALAPSLTEDQLEGHLPTAAFIAYYAARMKLRSEFTINGQQRPFDELASHLFDICARDGDTAWFAIAHVFPRADVLERLTEEQKGALLGQWHSILVETADRLERAWSTTDIDLDSMIVRRGNDSSTWNVLAAAWNRARDHWMALVTALGMDGLLDVMLPGKVMRLMAADVAAWHRQTGGAIHPDTLIWRELPKPWAVLQGTSICTRAAIEECCKQQGVDPAKSGWSAPRPRTAIATYRPTPELVHGVAVHNPYLAGILKRAGVFSGRPIDTAQINAILRD